MNIQFYSRAFYSSVYLLAAIPLLTGAIDDASTPQKAALAFGTALCAGDSIHARDVTVGSKDQLEKLDTVTAYFKAMADLQASVAKLPNGEKLPSELRMSPDLATIFAADAEHISGDTATLGNGSNPLSHSSPTFKKDGDTWKFDIAATAHDERILAQLVKLCTTATDELNAAKKQIDSGQARSVNDALPDTMRRDAQRINMTVSIIFGGQLPGMPGGMFGGRPPGAQRPDPTALLRAGANPDSLNKATKGSDTTPVVQPGFAVPETGPLVQVKPLVIDLAHQNLPGPDPRYTSWQGCKVGDYVLSSLKIHKDKSERTVREMDYLYAIDADGVTVLTLTETGSILPSTAGAEVNSSASGVGLQGRFNFYSSTAMNPADAGLLEGLKSGKDVPSPTASGNLGNVKSFTMKVPADWGTTIGAWASSKIPNLMTMSVRRNKEDVSVKTLIACHRSSGESWADTDAQSNLDLMLEVADPVKGPKMVSFTRAGGSWVGKYDVGMKADNPLTQAINPSFTMRQFVLVERDDKGKVMQTTVDWDLTYGADAIRNVRKGKWTPYVAVHPYVDAGIIETVTYNLKDHAWIWQPNDGHASLAFRGVPAFRPPFNDFVSAKQIQTALAMPDASQPAEDKRSGLETDHWGNLIESSDPTGQDRYLADHLAAILPKARLVTFNRRGFGCTFDYEQSPSTKVGLLEKGLAMLSEQEYDGADETFYIAAQTIYSDQAAPALDAEYQQVLAKHKNDPHMVASSPTKVTIAGQEGIAFTIDARDKDNNDIRTVEIFAIAPHRKIRLNFTMYRVHCEQAWRQLRHIMESMQLQD